MRRHCAPSTTSCSARQTVRKLTQELGFSLVDQTKMVTAASELARNAYIYGRGGTLSWEILERDGRRGLKLRFADEGPGIPNHGLGDDGRVDFG